MIKGRESNKALGGAPPADLLVCFPSRTHFTLMPKPICSPARPSSEPNKRHHHHHLKRLNTRAAITAGGGPGSPLVWAKNNQIRGGGPESSEPTSPKVTCAGQIKVRPRSATGCRNWQSVMEEIERIHNRAKHKKKSSSWAQTFRFKKDVMNFLTCLRNLRFDFRCFGSFPEQELSSDEDGDDVDDEDSFKELEDEHVIRKYHGNENNAVFSKWFMVLQENQVKNNIITSENNAKGFSQECKEEEGNDDCAPVVPPPNALLLMRCRSAPAKSWLEERESEEKENVIEEEFSVQEMIKDEDVKKVVEKKEEDVKVLKEVKQKKRETLAIVMKYDTDFYKLSPEIAQETWVVGGFQNHFSRSRSYRR